ncbi:MAG: 3'-5' exonuclease [Candidatus Eisenbacteria bacterium]|nr:3'-5' exonuclease [Candidatus Eisenbacteria bacterium]
MNERRLVLSRPLVVLDTETTGSVPFRDRIVEIAMLKVHPDGRKERYQRRVNPEIRIPVEAIAVHGITNEDVEFCPPFRKVASEITTFIGDADLCGFNVHGFDLRILTAELARCGESFSLDGRDVIDVQVIFHRREPRDLSAAVRFYLGREHEGAHGAEADTEATFDVLCAQIERYGDLDPTAPGLALFSKRSSDRHVDPDRKLEWRDGEACFCFGKYAGRRLREVMEVDPEYITWILERDFPLALKTIIREAQEGLSLIHI